MVVIRKPIEVVVREGWRGEQYQRVEQEFKTTEALVINIMTNFQITRNSDKWLIARVWEARGFASLKGNKLKIEIPVSKIKELNTPETITRCFPPDTTIMGLSGWKEINQFEEGELVFTHKGNFNKITKKIVNDYTGEILKIKVCGNHSKIKVTPEHPFLVARLTYKRNKYVKPNKNKKNYPNRTHWIAYFNAIDAYKLKWVKAKNLKKGDILVRPIMKSDIDKEYIELEKMKWCMHKGITINKDLMKLVGYYLSEGFIIKQKLPFRYQGLVFTFGKTEKELDLCEELSEALKNMGFKPAIRWREYGWYVRVASKQLVKFIEKNFGKGAKNKRIPFWILLLPKSKLKYLLESYINGDGYREGKTLHAVTISEKLSEGIKIIAEKMGYKVGIYLYGPANSTTMNISGRHPQFRIRINTEQKRKWDKHWREEIYSFAKIKEIKKGKYSGKVYNFEVDNDESYVTEIGAVHNCRRKIQNKDGMLLPTEVEVLVKRGIREEVIREFFGTDSPTYSAWQQSRYKIR